MSRKPVTAHAGCPSVNTHDASGNLHPNGGSSHTMAKRVMKQAQTNTAFNKKQVLNMEPARGATAAQIVAAGLTK